MHHARLALHCLTASLLTLPAAQASAACYTVYDAQGGVVQQADAPPASAAQAPYAVVGSGIAVVAPAHAEQVWERAPLVHPVVPAAGRPAVETVITEWADGRTDVEQRPVRTRR